MLVEQYIEWKASQNFPITHCGSCVKTDVVTSCQSPLHPVLLCGITTPSWMVSVPRSSYSKFMILSKRQCPNFIQFGTAKFVPLHLVEYLPAFHSTSTCRYDSSHILVKQWNFMLHWFLYLVVPIWQRKSDSILPSHQKPRHKLCISTYHVKITKQIFP